MGQMTWVHRTDPAHGLGLERPCYIQFVLQVCGSTICSYCGTIHFQFHFKEGDWQPTGSIYQGPNSVLTLHNTEQVRLLPSSPGMLVLTSLLELGNWRADPNEREEEAGNESAEA